MPIYEYKCRECGKSFEVYVRGGEAPKCPGCGSISLKKLISKFNSSGDVGGNKSSCGSCTGGTCSTCGK